MISWVATASEQAFLSFWEQAVRSSPAAYEVPVRDLGLGAQEAGVLRMFLPWVAPVLLSFPGAQTELEGR